MSAVFKPEGKISFTRKCLCSNSQTDLWKLEHAQRVDFVELLTTKQFIQGYLQHRRRKSCLGVAKAQISTPVFSGKLIISKALTGNVVKQILVLHWIFLSNQYAYYKRRMDTPWFRSLHVTECKVTLSPSWWSLEWLHHSSSRVRELLAPCIWVSWLF